MFQACCCARHEGAESHVRPSLLNIFEHGVHENHGAIRGYSQGLQWLGREVYMSQVLARKEEEKTDENSLDYSHKCSTDLS